MYSGTTISTYSGKLLGAHQKIDRVARRHLELLAPGAVFPSIKKILHFEGDNGPDGMKRKSPAHDEPWHFIQPFDEKDTLLTDLINDHYDHLVDALRRDDSIRAAFEAAWLAHAVVDGLTPAHHFPFEEKLAELRGGEGIETRRSVKEKILFPGETLREQAKNNWGFWGPKGLFTTHFAFEWGVSTLMKPLRLQAAMPTKQDLKTFHASSIDQWFRSIAQDVAHLKLYDRFYEEGWSKPLTKAVRRQLAPTIVKTVTTVWYGALQEARKTA
ncbi:hypothetical protein KDA23_01935 [Candidatus Saccharibacteria bacterium]|nr:hypothetical protein [Candidatus Saccharibacteria bacterium]